MEKESVLRQIYDHLKESGFDVYFPAQHQGDCTSDYVVVGYDGAIKVEGISTEQALYSILCYVPKNRYSYLTDFSESVKESLRDLFPLIRQTGNETSGYYAEEIDGHMVSIEYTNFRKLKYRK